MGDKGSWYDYDVFLQPQHLKGKRVTLKIIGFDEIEVNERGKRVIKPIIRFAGTKKFMFVNKSNRHILADLFGDQKIACIGKQITIQAVRLDNGKNSIVIYPAESNPLTALPGEKDKSALDQMWALATEHEEPNPGDLIESLLGDYGGDVDAALAALKSRYSKPTDTGKST